MFYQTESKAQCWRAIAMFDDRGDQLLYLGRSSTQVRAGYAEAFAELLEHEEKAHVCSISLQRWQGAPDSGRWIHQSNMIVPVECRVLRSA
jgi:hypothetical protein